MKKKLPIIVTSIALSAVLIAGATFAYLTAISNVKTNTFTVSDNIAIQLAENKWDNLNYDGETGTIPSANLGVTKAANIVPGREIPKNPSVKNDSDIESVWIAIKLDYKVNNAASDFATLNAFATINWTNATDWEVKDATNTVFYFKSAVAAQGNTGELFDKVTIKNVGHSALKPFDIVIKGYAVQAEGVDFATAKTQLDALMAP